MHKLIETLKEKIEANDVQGVKDTLAEMREVVLATPELIGEITQPTVITELHTLLTEKLGVHRRAIQLRARVPNRTSRALLFIKAMESGCKRLT